MNDKARASIEKAKQNLVEQMKNGDFSKTVSHTILPETIQPDVEVPSLAWSAHNKLLMQAHGYRFAAGYKQWRELGRHVKKGESSFYILAPRLKTVEETVEKVDPATGVTIEVEEEVKKRVGYLGIAVFGYEQTEGDELVLGIEPEELPPLYDMAEELGVDVEYAPEHPNRVGVLGSYTDRRQKITLRSHDESVFFHELGHALHYRVEDLESTCGQDPYRESVAETLAGVLCEYYGVEGYAPKTYHYLDQHSGEDESAAEGALAVMEVVDRCLQTLFSLRKEGEHSLTGGDIP